MTNNIKELGSFYTKDKTTFRVYAPYSDSVSLVLDDKSYPMAKRDETFTLEVCGDLEKHLYHFENEKGSFIDPFAYANTLDNNNSIILDTDKFIKETVTPKERNSTSIYEISIRDFTSSPVYNGNYKGKFLALTETGLKYDGRSIGLDYLKELGISHLQIMPIFDFDDDEKDDSGYNWGYNPLSYSSLKYDYAKDPSNPYNLVNEFRKTVNVLHENDIRVTLDVVFNHVYNTELFALEKMLSGHAFRRKEDGTLANGSLCGNELMSEDPFIRAYLVELCERFVKTYDIDGLRFDIMGLIDVDTMNAIRDRLVSIKKDILIYGEGWTMGEALKDEEKASLYNLEKMPGISSFNPFFKDIVISYACGNEGLRNEVKDVFNGYNEGNMPFSQSINYVECHDNYTFFDRINFSNEEFEAKKRRSKLALAFTILSRGTPFIHSGEEFLRTKHGIENSYNASDEINMLDWRRMTEFPDMVEFVKGLLKIREKYADNFLEEANVYDYYEVIVFEYRDLKIFFNPCQYDHVSNDGYIYKMIFDGYSLRENDEGIISIPAYGVVILDKSEQYLYV